MNKIYITSFCASLPLMFLLSCSFSEGNLLEYGKYKDVIIELEQQIDPERIMADIRHLSLNIGPRPAGSVNANEAANWFKERLQQMGCIPQVHFFRLPDGSEGRNILCLLEGRTPQTIVLSTHLDTVEQSPGANDDASGLALLLELARLFRQYKFKPENTIIIAGFGAEEAIEGFYGHTYGSLSYLKSLSTEARRKIVGCIYLDKLGVGQNLAIRNIIFTDSQMAEFCREEVKKINKSGGSLSLKHGWLLGFPHSFEKYDIPTAWIEWAPDPHMHQANDLPENITEENILLVAKLMLHVLSKKY
jgi:hypothetical protein